jgi:tetratricopeptide (TPR) repeat protein
MPVLELELSFPTRDLVSVSVEGEETIHLPFVSPLSTKDHQDLAWYLATYAAYSLGEPDDKEAQRIVAQLSTWGKGLFDAVFADRAAQRLLNTLQDDQNCTHLLTIRTAIPSILSLPWELLHDSANGGVFLFNENPPISIRRWVVGARGGRRAQQVVPKERLHLLFIVSRPENTGFLDPRADAGAVLDALEEGAPGRFTWEFLRPPTIDALSARLRDKMKPAVDVIHFDGHGAFDSIGGIRERFYGKGKHATSVAAGTTVKHASVDLTEESPPNTGYLLFETSGGDADLVAADQLGVNLHRRVPLVVLSACQSGAVGGNEEAMGSVAVRLTAAGIPAVLAMAHPVLVYTTRPLFSAFYGELARSQTIGEAIDAARLYLYNHPEKYQLQRGPERVWLSLRDWFVPTLYQAGTDVPLMRPNSNAPLGSRHQPRLWSGVPPSRAAGFFGRKRELWNIERWFERGTRRITVSGLGGQGKTALAQEAAHWLLRIGMFQAVAFVDYSGSQSEDAVAIAVNQIARVLEQNLLDSKAVMEALRAVSTLVVLDNLEALGPVAMRELLDAARAWSEAGESRLLMTSRTSDFDHADYPNANALDHQRILLSGLGQREYPEDALEWFAALSKLPPTPAMPPPRRQALIELFDEVKFHPLSIRVLADQLRTRRAAELGRRLHELVSTGLPLTTSPSDVTLPELMATIRLSLDRLDPSARALLPRLGVFADGAFEDDLMAVTGLDGNERAVLESAIAAADTPYPTERINSIFGDLDKNTMDEMSSALSSLIQASAAELSQRVPRLPAVADATFWPKLLSQLEASGLVSVEQLQNDLPAYVRFHPTLAPLLWSQLDFETRDQLIEAHRVRYRRLAGYLYARDSADPVLTRAIVRQDLGNLLRAFQASFDANDSELPTFAAEISMFLNIFGFARESAHVADCVASLSLEEGSTEWMSAEIQRADRLRDAGDLDDAIWVYESVLARLPTDSNFSRSFALRNLSRAFTMARRPDLAITCIQEAIALTTPFQKTSRAKRFLIELYASLGDLLREIGLDADARSAYETSLHLSTETADTRSQAVILSNLGMLAKESGDLMEALQHHQALLDAARILSEPDLEAIAHHQLGTVYLLQHIWPDADLHFREAARIKQELGIIGGQNGAANTWHQLGLLYEMSGKSASAESWYLKAIEGFQSGDQFVEAHSTLHNLAVLLQRQPGRLADAERHAQQALAFKRTLDPGLSLIWNTYALLGTITSDKAALVSNSQDQETLQAQARKYRQQAYEAKRHYEVRRHWGLIVASVKAIDTPALRPELEEQLVRTERQGSTRLATAIRRIVGGDRDTAGVLEGLGLEDMIVLQTIMSFLADPSMTDSSTADPQ